MYELLVGLYRLRRVTYGQISVTYAPLNFIV